MKSFTVTALGIACKIWIIAVLINTIADTLLIGIISGDSAEFFFLIALFGGIFSAPIFLVIWGILYSLLKRGSNARYILKWLLIAGPGMAVAAWVVIAGSFHFLDSEILRLVIVAPLAGAIAVYAGYSNIKKACIARDGEKALAESFHTKQPSAGGNIPDVVC